jgi:hypothetical protein
MDTFIFKASNVPIVLETFCTEAFKFNPLEVMTIDEIVEMFYKDFSKDWENNFEVAEDKFQEFLTKVGDTATDRLLGKMVKDGVLDISHNGEEFCFSLPKGK